MKSSDEILKILRPELDALEQRRLELNAKRAQGTGWMIAVLAVAFLVAVMGSRSGGIGSLFIGAIIAIIGWAIIWSLFFGKAAEEFKRLFKEKVVACAAREIAPGMSYQPSGFISKDWFVGSGLFTTRPDRYSGEDYFAGRVGQTELFFSEVHAQDKRTRTDSNGNTSTYYVTIFKGLFVVADFHKDFRSTVYVRPDKLESFGSFGRALQGLAGNVERMENVEFERRFKVTATDSVEARYLLTPAMQERFIELAENYSTELRAAFKGSLLYLAIPKTADWFEGQLGTPVDDQHQMKTICNELRAAVHLVDALDLNTRIWTKQ
ncbi:MAG: DUF3137 domain-containing protein [Verrucomicrobiota bacterium JB023]|nr:DUF3137 domain-containing protein [Verrucomicrobiota bacterium JB023]